MLVYHKFFGGRNQWEISRIQQMEVLTNVPYVNGQIGEIPWNGLA